VFLGVNGYSFKAGQVDAIHFMLGLASGDLDEAGLSSWIAANMVARP
jgi:prophage maintenance system killer protein